MKTTRVTEWTTTDGRTHRDRTIASAHQNWLDLVELLHDAIGASGASVVLVQRRKDVLRLLRTAAEAP